MRIYIARRYLALYNYNGGCTATPESASLYRVVLNIESHVPSRDRKDKLRAALARRRAEIVRFSYSRKGETDQFSCRLAFRSNAGKSNNPLIRALCRPRRGRLCCTEKWCQITAARARACDARSGLLAPFPPGAAATAAAAAFSHCRRVRRGDSRWSRPLHFSSARYPLEFGSIGRILSWDKAGYTKFRYIYSLDRIIIIKINI